MPPATIATALFDSPISPDIEAPTTRAGFMTASSNGCPSFLTNSQAACSAKVLLFEYALIAGLSGSDQSDSSK